MKKTDGIVKSKVSRELANAIFLTAMGFAFGGIITLAVGGIGGGIVTRKMASEVKEYMQSETYVQQVADACEENVKYYDAGEIDKEQFYKNIAYYHTEDYAKELLKADVDSTYSASLQKSQRYNRLFYVGAIEMCSGFVVGLGTILFRDLLNAKKDIKEIDERVEELESPSEEIEQNDETEEKID